jgi:hypothetical protein
MEYGACGRQSLLPLESWSASIATSACRFDAVNQALCPAAACAIIYGGCR